jgi:large subunit ribosomal protein L27Ae
MDSHPGYFGKVGNRTFHYTDNRNYCPTVNVEGLWGLLSADVQAKAVKDSSKAPVLDVTAAVRLLLLLL